MQTKENVCVCVCVCECYHSFKVTVTKLHVFEFMKKPMGQKHII